MKDPVYQESDGWWYQIWGEEFGPYGTQEAAQSGYEMHMRTLASGCPTCED